MLVITYHANINIKKITCVNNATVSLIVFSFALDYSLFLEEYDLYMDVDRMTGNRIISSIILNDIVRIQAK